MLVKISLNRCTKQSAADSLTVSASMKKVENTSRSFGVRFFDGFSEGHVKFSHSGIKKG